MQGMMKGQNRIRLVMALFLACFVAVPAKLGLITFMAPDAPEAARAGDQARIPRPPIVDRNGQMLATDIRLPSLYADPRKIIDVDEAVELITATLPDVNAADLRNKLTLKPGQRKAFVWIKRELTQSQRDRVHDLGVPGLYFRLESKRIYPMGRMASHVLGYVDVDSHGLAGVEKYLDDKGAIFKASLAENADAAQPVQLSIDVRVQHALTDELARALTEYQAIAGAGVVMDVRTGEVIAAASLPDYNPNDPVEAQKPAHLNRFTGGAFELGSVVKTISFAMALDAGSARMDSRYDARHAIPAGRSQIDDYHPTRRVLSLPEVFVHSSNIGTVKMALEAGLSTHEAFLQKIGLYDRLRTEIPETAAPMMPRKFTRVSAMTASFGHGISFQPLQLAQIACALVNGGVMMQPTFIKRDAASAMEQGTPIISADTSAKMRELLRLNVTSPDGTGGKADVVGYEVGGKTGTAEKVVNGRYSGEHRFNSFLAAFPMRDPRYVSLILIDEPKPTPDSHGYATAGWNAVPTSARLIARIAPMLGVTPQLSPEEREVIAAQELKLQAARQKEAAAATGGVQ